jgi:hypothetical protein
MKCIPNLMSHTKITSSIVSRRRDRQRSNRASTPRAFTYDLASLHLQALMCIAGVDACVTRAEFDEAVAFLDRASLPPADVERLRRLAPVFADSPPPMEALLEPLTAFAAHPARARALATDLARIVAVERRAHPRELLLMDEFCAALGVASSHAPAPAPRAVIDLASQYRLRASVARALETSAAA